MKGNIKIGIATLLVLLMALSTAGTASAASKSLTSGNVTIDFLNAKSTDTQEVTYDYGDTIKLDLVYPADSDSTQWLDIKDRDNANDRIKRYSLSTTGVDDISIPLSTYDPATNFTFHLYTSKNGGETVNTSDPSTLDGTTSPWLIYCEVVEPQISLSIDNPSVTVAKGDNVKFEGTITAPSYNWTLTGPYDKSAYFEWVASNSTAQGTLASDGESTYVSAKDHDIDVTIPTGVLLDAGGSTGTWEFEVWHEDDPDASASIEFKLAGVSVSAVTNKDTIQKGDSLTISGTTNIAETDSTYDQNQHGSNKVFIAVYNDTSAEEDNFVAGFWDNVDEDGTFSKDILFKLEWEADTTYQIDVIPMTIWNTSMYGSNPSSFSDVENRDWALNYDDTANYSVYYDDESLYVDVEEPEVKFQMDDLTFTRGESDISFKGTSSLPAGSSVYIPKSDLEDFVETTSWDSLPGTTKGALKAMVGTDGTWETKDVNVKDKASLGTYKIEAQIFDENDDKLNDDSVSIRIVKQELDASIDKTSVTKGGEITINGSTSVGSVFIFASETWLFDQEVTENPTETNYTDLSLGNDYEVPVDDDTFSKKLDVNTSADTGSYMLYVYAPSTTEYLNRAEDPQKIFSLTINDVAFTEVPETIKMVQGESKDLEFKVPESADNNVYVEFTFTGAGMKIDAKEYSQEFYQEPDDGVVELTLNPFWYDASDDQLTSDYRASGLTPQPSCKNGDWENLYLLPVGTYALEAELFYDATGDSIEEVKVPVQIIQPTLSVDMPSEVSLGDSLDITVETNRDDNYDGIYVVLDRGLTPVPQKVNTDENGTAIASFETLGLGMGSYKIYIRDTMNTISCDDEGIEDFYDWDPALEKSDWASDDMYTVKTVSVVQEAVTTPTPTPTEQPTETPTETPTEVPTEQPTETPTEVPTTPPTTATPTPTEGPETPGFEVFFAVAGLLAVAYLLRRR